MANVRPYINHLLQSSGITPACSEEERLAAEDLAQIFRKHGFEPEVQEFSASGSKKMVNAVLGIAVFVGAVLMGIGGIVGVVGLLLALAGGVLFTLERMGKTSLSRMGGAGLSQNVIAYHKASGPLASPRNRPVVVVAHYDSPRADLLSQMPYAAYRPLIVKALPYAMLVPAVIAIVRLLPLPGAAKVVLWILAILVALVPLASAVATILNRFVLPYTTGAVCNKSSVAAMLGVMNAVAPFRGEREFPEDVPFGKYMREQRRLAAAAARAAAEAEAARAAKRAGAAADAEVPADADAAAQPAEGAEGAAVPAPDASEALAAAAGAAAAGAGAALAAGAAVDVAAEGAEPVVDLGATQAMEMQPTGETASFAAVEEAAPAPVELIEVEEEPADEEQVAEASAEVMGADEVADAPEEAPAGSSAAEVAEDAVAEAPSAPEPVLVNAEGNYRYGVDTLRSLGMVPASCVIEYDEPEPVEPAAEPVPVVEAAPSAAEEPVSAVTPEAVENEPAAAVPTEQDDVEGDFGDEDAYAEDDDAYGDEDFAEDDYDEDDYDEDDDFDYDGEAAYDDEDYAFDYQPSAYEATGLARFGGRGGNVVETLSQVGATAARFFGEALSRGKSALSHLEGVAHDVAGRIGSSADEEAPEPSADEQMPVDDVENPVTDGAGAPEEVDEPAVDEPTVAYAPIDDEAVAASLEKTVAGAPAPVDEAPSDGTEAPSEGDEPMADAPAGGADAAADEGTPAEPAAAPVAGGDVPLTGATVAFTVQPVVGTADATAVSEAQRPVETVDSLMAEINPPRPAAGRRMPLTVPDPQQPSLNQPSAASRASLFDLPDPSAPEADPFAPQSASGSGGATASRQTAQAPAPAQQPGAARSFSVIDPAQPAAPAVSAAPAAPEPAASPFEVLSADAPAISRPQEEKRRGLFRRKKQQEPSMGEYLGLGDDFDAKSSGRDIGSWDNFENDDWKGGATGAAGVSADELRDAVTSLGDDELLGHDIWFVATGASEYGNAGIEAFLATHRDKLRGVFLINLECVGAGQIAMLSTEGDHRVLKGDKRIMNLVRKVSGAFHHEFGAVDMPYLATDAYVAMNMSLRSLTIAGVDGPCLACSHSEEDLPLSVDVDNINRVADVVTEVIRRS